MIGRFISADTFATTDSEGFLSANMFAYCENDSVNKADPFGFRPIWEGKNGAYTDTGTGAYSYTKINGIPCPDITKELNAMMDSHASMINNYFNKRIRNTMNLATAIYETSLYFANKVKTKAPWDLKNTTYQYYSQVIYNGQVFTPEDIGNIHYGYVGSVLFDPLTLHLGAGVYQIKSGTRLEYWSTFLMGLEIIRWSNMASICIMGEDKMKKVICFLLCILTQIGLSGCIEKESISEEAIAYARDNSDLLCSCSQDLYNMIKEKENVWSPRQLTFRIEPDLNSTMRLCNYRTDSETSFENELCQKVFQGGVVDYIMVYCQNDKYNVEFSCCGIGLGSAALDMVIQFNPSDDVEDLVGYDRAMIFTEQDEGWYGKLEGSDNTFLYYKISDQLYYTEASF